MPEGAAGIELGVNDNQVSTFEKAIQATHRPSRASWEGSAWWRSSGVGRALARRSARVRAGGPSERDQVLCLGGRRGVMAVLGEGPVKSAALAVRAAIAAEALTK